MSPCHVGGLDAAHLRLVVSGEQPDRWVTSASDDKFCRLKQTVKGIVWSCPDVSREISVRGYDASMTSELGPTVRRKQLGAALRQLREAAKISMDEVAAHLDRSRSGISQMETGRTAPRKPDLESLLRLYGADDQTAAALEELRREGSKRGWWSTYKLPDYLADLVGLEDDAIKERVVELELIPALLQTPDYAKAVHVVGSYSPPAAEIERRVAVRMQRQRRLVGAEPLEFSAVVSEAALLRTAADPDVGPEQLRHLVEKAELLNVSLRVLPFRVGLHGSMSGSFILLDFAPGVSVSAAYQEYAAGGHMVDDQDVVRLLSDLHNRLRGQALGDDESLALIAELAQQAERG
jgi:transcriptional regulator with XRE-family HTH domain